MAGDYGHFAQYLEPRAALAVPGPARCRSRAYACSTSAAAPARLRFPPPRPAPTSPASTSPPTWSSGPASAAEAGVQAQFDEGDAEALPYPDASFDLVVSLIGAMFAPRPELVAAELLRVPAGRAHRDGQLDAGKAMSARCSRSSASTCRRRPLMPSPMKWGDEATVRERLGGRVATDHHAPHVPDALSIRPRRGGGVFLPVLRPTVARGGDARAARPGRAARRADRAMEPQQ